MDPNTALEEARGLAHAIRMGTAHQGADVELAEQFQALDEWIATGGFLPDGWRQEERFLS